MNGLLLIIENRFNISLIIKDLLKTIKHLKFENNSIIVVLNTIYSKNEKKLKNNFKNLQNIHIRFTNESFVRNNSNVLHF